MVSLKNLSGGLGAKSQILFHYCFRVRLQLEISKIILLVPFFYDQSFSFPAGSTHSRFQQLPNSVPFKPLYSSSMFDLPTLLWLVSIHKAGPFIPGLIQHPSLHLVKNSFFTKKIPFSFQLSTSPIRCSVRNDSTSGIGDKLTLSSPLSHHQSMLAHF